MYFTILHSNSGDKQADIVVNIAITVIYLLFQIYTGRYIPPSNRQNPVEQVECFMEGLQVETFVAVHLSNCEEEPVIGVIKEVTEEQFTIHYWKGTYRGRWCPLNKPRSREPWTQVLPKECIIMHSFELTEAKKLQPTTKNFLRNKYATLKSVADDN